MKELGYEFCGSRNTEKTYYLFVLRDNNEYSLHHIHCYSKDEEEYFKLVGFRDYLNKNRSCAKEYSVLKENLAQKYSDNRALYTSGKEEFIKMVYSKLNLCMVDVFNNTS